MTLKAQLTSDMKTAMKAGDKQRLGVIRLMNAAIKQKEVDEPRTGDGRAELDDAQVLAVLEKMVKQRRDSISQYDAAGRQDLADIERAEMAVIESYLGTDDSAIKVLTITINDLNNNRPTGVEIDSQLLPA